MAIIPGSYIVWLGIACNLQEIVRQTAKRSAKCKRPSAKWRNAPRNARDLPPNGEMLREMQEAFIIRQSKSTRFPIKKYKNGTCFSRPVFCIPFTPRKGAFSPPFGRLLYFLEGRRVDQIEHDDLIAACLHCGTAAAEGGNRIAQRLTLEDIM